jgi:circadian clock protein KaiC
VQENIGGSGRKNAIPGLAHIFREALPASALLLTGPSGSGKTMYCMQFIRDGVAAGERCAYISFDPLFTEEKFKKSVGGQARFAAPLVKGSRTVDGLLDEIKMAVDAGTSRVAIDSITHLLPYFAEGDVIRLIAALYGIVKEDGATAILTLTTAPSRDLSDTLASLLDGILQLKLEDEGDELARSIRLLSIRGMYHSPSWVRFDIREDGRLAFGQDEAESTCKLCDKPVTGKAAFDSGSAFHPHCLGTYR